MSLVRTARNVAGRLVPFMRRRGVLPVLVSCARWGVAWVAGRVTVRRTPPTFDVDGEALRYVHHPYNNTWLNERAVEVSLARRLVERRGAAGLLEVGNVLGHYGAVEHRVVDKYEAAAGVENVDVLDLVDGTSYATVVSVSTLEHVGLDEVEQDPTKPDRAIATLKSLLAPGGLLWVTVPVGYNTALDESLREGRHGFTRLTALRREARRNAWSQVPVEHVWDAPYDRLLYTAHGLLVAEYEAPGRPKATRR